MYSQLCVCVSVWNFTLQRMLYLRPKIFCILVFIECEENYQIRIDSCAFRTEIGWDGAWIDFASEKNGAFKIVVQKSETRLFPINLKLFETHRYPMPSLSRNVCTIFIIQKLCVSHEAVVWCDVRRLSSRYGQTIPAMYIFVRIPPPLLTPHHFSRFAFGAAFVHNEQRGLILCSNRFPQKQQNFLQCSRCNGAACSTHYYLLHTCTQ